MTEERAEPADGDKGQAKPNRLAVAAFVAVFVPVAMGVGAVARRLIRGRR